MIEKVKVKVSSFVADILENDAMRFGFEKNGHPNKNALLNKLIPTLVEARKSRREEIKRVLKNDFHREDAERIYDAVNTVIDKVYFKDEELDVLDEYIWIRPSKNTFSIYDEIKTSEVVITAQEFSVYIRSLLNEYARFPQYKREALTFDAELDVFTDACTLHRILHFHDKSTGKSHRVFAVNYYYGYLYDQRVLCVFYDLNEKVIRAIPIYDLGDPYMIKQKYTPSEVLIGELQSFVNNMDFDETVKVEEE